MIGDASDPAEPRLSVEWNPRNGTVFGILGGNVLEWDLGDQTWKTVIKDEKRQLGVTKWAPDGKSILSHFDGELHWLGPDGREKSLPKTLKRFRHIPHDAFDWAPAGDAIWIGYGLASKNCPPASMQRTPGHTYHGLYRIPLSGKPSSCLKRVCGIRRISVSPTGEYVATVIDGWRSSCAAGGSKVAVFHAKSGKRIDLGNSAPLYAVHWHPKSAKILYVSAREPHGPTVSDLAEQQEVTLPPYEGQSLWSTTFHPVTGRVWASNHQTILELVDGKWQARCRWDGKKFIAAD